MNPRPELIDLGAEIADGRPVDWSAVANQDVDPGTRGVIRRLRLVERIAQVHASLPPAASFTRSLHRSLMHHDGAALSEDAPITWGPLTILEKIGRGTFGDVYRACDPRLDRPVALKLLRHREHETEALETAVIEEGRLMARVRHPNVVTIYGAERIDGRVGLWMELVEGRTLEQELRSHGPLRPTEVIAIGIAVCRALDAVHRAGLLHRDLKAQNVMRDRDGRVVLTDFGAGCAVDDRPGNGRELAGTPLYLAPEVLDGQPASVASDVYSLGVLLYYLTNGTFPVNGRSLADLRDAHRRRPPAGVRVAAGNVPRRLSRVIDRAIDADPARRYRKASGFESALTRASRSVVSARRIGVAAAVVALLVASAMGLRNWRQPTAAVRLAFQPRDLVLVTRFENKTGEPVFAGAIEYALERELSNSDTVGLVSADRIADALRLMKKAADTVVDRTVGREVSLRDGAIKAMVTGRIERIGGHYVLTADLVNPEDGAIVASVSERARSQRDILNVIRRETARIREALGERRDRIRQSRQIEQVSTASLRAFQLYNQSYELGRQGKWGAALEFARQAIEIDPEFASGWIWVAWSLARTRAPEADVRAAAERAVALSVSVADWERHWILGSYRSLTRDHAGAIGSYEALLSLRPDHLWAVNNLLNASVALGRADAALAARRLMADLRPNDLTANYLAAFDTVRFRRSRQEADAYIKRLRALVRGALTEAPTPLAGTAAVWLAALPAYEAWASGDVQGAQQQIEQVAADLFSDDLPQVVLNSYANTVGGFYLSLGRLREAATIYQKMENPSAAYMVLADVRDDLPEMRRQLLRLGDNQGRPMRFIKAGLIDQAKTIIDGVRSSGVGGAETDAYRSLARGDLALLAGRPDLAVPHFKQGLFVTLSSWTSEYYEGCNSLATAYERLRQVDDAIATLVSCTASHPPYAGLFSGFFWLKARLHLADDYRVAKRFEEAIKIEQDLRKYLTYADADHPLLKRLNAR